MTKLSAINKKIDNFKQELVSIDYIIRGSIKKVFNRCGKKQCTCHKDSNKLHGPYFLFTKKIKGKTTGRHYSQEEAGFLQPYLKKYNYVIEIIRQISELSDKAVDIILNQRKKEKIKKKGERKQIKK